MKNHPVLGVRLHVIYRHIYSKFTLEAVWRLFACKSSPFLILNSISVSSYAFIQNMMWH